MSVCGIDFSTKGIELVLIDDDTDEPILWEHLTGIDATSFDRARHVRTVMPTRSWWDEHGVWLIGVEAVASPHPQTINALSRIQGAIAATIPVGIAAFEMRANEWQRLFLRLTDSERLPRTSKERKPLVKAKAIELGFGDAPDLPSDPYDAYGIAWAARHLNERCMAETTPGAGDTP